MDMTQLIAGIETGGTKIVVALAHRGDPRLIRQRMSIPTRGPEETLQEIRGILAMAGSVVSVGIASFGPLDLDTTSAGYGCLTATPKLDWTGTDVVRGITADLAPLTAEIVTDVNGSALGESRWGAGAGVERFAYVTVGTGVGAGLVQHGDILGGSGWPEVAHLLVRRHTGDTFVGLCPFHGDCLEGLASGPAVLARWGSDGSRLDPVSADLNRSILSFYLAQLTSTLVYTVGIDRVILGGGVAKTPGLLRATEEQVARLMGPSGANGTATGRIRILPPALGDDAGVLGALALAQRAVDAVATG